MSVTDVPVALGETMGETSTLDVHASSRKKWNAILNCSFDRGTYWVWCIVPMLVAVGIVCGMIIMPIYLDMALSNVVVDQCVVNRCAGYTARVSLVGLEVADAEVAMSKPCYDVRVGDKKDCFVRIDDIGHGNYTVHFERPYLATATVVGMIGWVVLLLPLLAWGCRVLHSKESTIKARQFTFWMIVGVLAAYGTIAGVIAMPVVISDMQYDGLTKDLCDITHCQAVHFATVHAESFNRTRATYLPNCDTYLQKRITCYVGASPFNPIFTYKPGQATAIGLGITGWFLNVVFIGWALRECATCVWADVDMSEDDDDDNDGLRQYIARSHRRHASESGE